MVHTGISIHTSITEISLQHEAELYVHLSAFCCRTRHFSVRILVFLCKSHTCLNLYSSQFQFLKSEEFKEAFEKQPKYKMLFFFFSHFTAPSCLHLSSVLTTPNLTTFSFLTFLQVFQKHLLRFHGKNNFNAILHQYSDRQN